MLLEGSNSEKWGGHQKKKFFINYVIEALIQLILIKSYCVYLLGGVPVLGKVGRPPKEGIFYETDKRRTGRLLQIYYNCVYILEGLLDSSIVDKMGRQQKEEVLK